MTEKVANIIRVIESIDTSILNKEERLILARHFIKMATSSMERVVSRFNTGHEFTV